MGAPLSVPASGRSLALTPLRHTPTFSTLRTGTRSTDGLKSDAASDSGFRRSTSLTKSALTPEHWTSTARGATSRRTDTYGIRGSTLPGVLTTMADGARCLRTGGPGSVAIRGDGRRITTDDGDSPPARGSGSPDVRGVRPGCRGRTRPGT